LQIQEARATLKDDMAAFRVARDVAELAQDFAEIVKSKIRIVSTSHELFKEFFGLAHAPEF
jgi:hypothetical protein